MSAITPVTQLLSRSGYARATSLRPIDLRLDANEGGAFAAQALQSTRLNVNSVRRYPDAREVESFLASKWNIAPDRVVVTAGADDALQRICSAMLEPGRRAVYCMPSFEMLRRYVRFTGAAAIEVSWPDGPLPVTAVIESALPAAVLFIVSPNNPTGAVATRQDLILLRESLPNTVIALDAAYVEFADDDLTELALSMPWTVVTRTLSKAWSSAGLRVGYAAGDARIIEWLRAVGQPYAASGVSLAMAKSLLEESEPAQRLFIARVREERSALLALLRDLAAEPIDGQANFVLARFSDAALVADLLEGAGIAVRRFDAETGLTDSLRITCPGEVKAFDRLTSALRAALRPQAILFDLDGVLADVSRSYREAIRLAAAEFGVAISPDEISRDKAAGNANNDWVLTHRLLKSRGIEVSFDRVKRSFERAYQGGLWKSETLLAPRSLLDSLQSRYRLGIVTGRPRCDAMRFLRQHDIDAYFGAIVCMEDTETPKPDPAPTKAALDILGVRWAWLIGDTPDDLVSARGAGVIPIGCIAPGESRDGVEPVLLRAGAARVLDSVATLEEILP